MIVKDFMVLSGALAVCSYVLVEDNEENIAQLKSMGCTDEELEDMRSDEDDKLDVYDFYIKRGYSFSPQQGFYKN